MKYYTANIICIMVKCKCGSQAAASLIWVKAESQICSFSLFGNYLVTMLFLGYFNIVKRVNVWMIIIKMFLN